MKHIIYTYNTSVKSGYTVHTVSIWQIKNNIPLFICEESDSLTGEYHLTMEILIKHKLIPVKYKTINPVHGGYEYNLVSLCNKGIIRITRIN